MTELPVLSGAEMVRALQFAGFVHVSQRGSHVKMRNQSGRTAIIPVHRELRKGTLRSILRQAGLTPDELRDLLSRF